MEVVTLIMNIPALRTVLRHIEKEAARDYKAEYRDYHGKPSKIKERAQRNAARSELGLKPHDGKEVDHKNPISNGGSNSKRNLRAVSRETNRKKGAKKE
jgi:5-methylcytosine-specific restriction endonuclease McrA